MEDPAELDTFDVTASEAPEAVEADAPKAPSKRKPKTPKAPAPPTIEDRVSKLKPLPWNALNIEIIQAYNELLSAVQEPE